MNILGEDILGRANPAAAPGMARFFRTGPGEYGEGDVFLGVKVPAVREAVRRRWREVGFGEIGECLASPYHEERLAGLLALVEMFAHARKDPERRAACADFYLAHTERINNWDLVDLSCYALLGEWLVDRDRGVLYRLAREGRSIWERRIGIVSTMAFVRRGELGDTFAIADILLHDPYDLIHKAVGWLLREAGKRDAGALRAFLEPRCAEMPWTMLRYAIEKFPEAERKGKWLAAGRPRGRSAR